MSNLDLYHLYDESFYQIHFFKCTDNQIFAEKKNARGHSALAQVQEIFIKAVIEETNHTHISLLRLKNAYLNYKRLNKYVISPHNNSWKSTFLFWQKIPDLSGQVERITLKGIEKLVDKVLQLA